MKSTFKIALLGSIVALTLTACGAGEKAEHAATATTAAATTAVNTTGAAANTAANAVAAAPVAATAAVANLVKDKNGCIAYPKNEWMPEADAKAKLAEMGYKAKSFEVTGNCYEMYGHDKEGNKAEVYFDAKTMAIVKKGD